MKVNEVLHFHPKAGGPYETDWLKAQYVDRPTQHNLNKVHHYMGHRYGSPLNRKTAHKDGRYVYGKSDLQILVPATVKGIEDNEQEYEEYKELGHKELLKKLVYIYDTPVLYVRMGGNEV